MLRDQVPDSPVQHSHHFKEIPQGTGRVEVIVHGLLKTGKHRLHLLPHFLDPFVPCTLTGPLPGNEPVHRLQ